MNSPSSHDPIGRIVPLLQSGSSTDLAIAYQQASEVCRKNMSLDALTLLLKEEKDLLGSTGLDLEVQEEIVGRFLKTACRTPLRDAFLDFLVVEGHHADPLYQFVHQYYKTSRLETFAGNEAKFLNELRGVAGASVFKPIINSRLRNVRWRTPSSRSYRFQVIFSNQKHYADFPGLLVPGSCINFDLTSREGTHKLSAFDMQFVSPAFAKAAGKAEDLALTLAKGVPLTKYRRVEVLENLETVSMLDGTSGFLSFIIAHAMSNNGIRLSPYIGFTGAVKDYERFYNVADVKEKALAAIAEGLRVLFVPEGSERFDRSDCGFIDDILDIVPYKIGGSITDVARSVFDRSKAATKQFTPTLEAAEQLEKNCIPDTLVVEEQRTETPSVEPLVSAKPILATRTLGHFAELGGYQSNGASSRLAVWNPNDRHLLSVSTTDRKLRCMDEFGSTLYRLDMASPPIAATWIPSIRRYLVACEDRFMTLSSNLWANGQSLICL